jgi:hypothetical protein
VICETKCIWSHYLLLDREKSLPDLALSLRTRAGPLRPMHATLGPTKWPYLRVEPLCSFVEQITLPRGIGRQPSQ